MVEMEQIYSEKGLFWNLFCKVVLLWLFYGNFPNFKDRHGDCLIG